MVDRAAGFAHRIGKGKQVVRGGSARAVVAGESEHFPAAGSRQTFTVLLT